MALEDQSWRPRVARGSATGAAEQLIRVALAVALVLGAAVAAATAGWALGGAVTAKPTPAGPTPARIVLAGPLSVRVDGSWPTAQPPRDVARAGLPDLQAFAPVPGLPARSWVARAPVDDPSLVPAAVRGLLAAPLPAPTPATLAGRPAWRFSDVALRSGDLLELTVQPTRAGVLMVGCQAAQQWWRATTGCADGVRGVEGATVLPPRAELAFVERSPAVLARLNAGRSAGARALRAARSARRQAAAASRLSRVHRSAADALAPLAVSPAQHGLVDALSRSATAFAGLAAAARADDASGYAQARSEAAAAQAATQAALRDAGA